ncbi:MAG: GIY-YIG nuclease family protein [Methylobacter sp.]|nr:GIY-YIG nuclease family protein [Methylobacter sp.]
MTPKSKRLKVYIKLAFQAKLLRNVSRMRHKNLPSLMADVKLLSEFQTYNLNPQKLELLLHTFFAESCLNIDVFDNEGKRHTPREWFIAPLHAIETAVKLLINGEIVNYRYDNNHQEIIEK